MRDRRRTLLIVAGVAVTALVVGLAAGARLMSPADAAARTAPPAAGPITVPVEQRVLESRVVTRGDASFAGAVELVVELGGSGMPPIVTGRVPKAGDEVVEGQPVLEIAGRPVIALEGDLPVYRTLRPGLSGPDVEQLEERLHRLGFDPGPADGRYTAATGRAVRELFDSVGYQPPEADPDVRAAADVAREAVSAAEDEVRIAEQELAAASEGPPESARAMAEHAVEAAERALADATDAGDADLVAEAEAALQVARLERDELLADPDASAQRRALDAAQGRLSEARAALEEALSAAGTPLPAAEVVYVETLPRRVDEVSVRRGDQVDGAVMSVSGADMAVTAVLDRAERSLLEVGMAAVVDLPSGDRVDATVTAIEQASDDAGWEVVVTPALASAQVEELRSANVRVTIPVTSTEDEVLAVPLAALTAGPGGESRVEVLRDSGTVLVTVDVGLTADGYAEVVPADGRLGAGDLVVVGR